MKKFAGRDLSLKLLYDKSKTSRQGKEPNPLGRLFSLFMLCVQNQEVLYSMTILDNKWIVTRIKLELTLHLELSTSALKPVMKAIHPTGY